MPLGASRADHAVLQLPRKQAPVSHAAVPPRRLPELAGGERARSMRSAGHGRVHHRWLHKRERHVLGLR